MHYLVKSKSSLVSSMEIESNSGAFFVPTQHDGTLFPHYRFHFTIYLGNGEFFEDEQGRKLFTGVAVSAKIKRQDSLILLFGFSCLPHIPFIEENDEFVMPILELMSRKTLNYTGSLAHADFKLSFVELSHPEFFDKLLENYRISVIGCDPTTQYVTK